jgi:site-specific DNA-methyltransferase (adenine-specific)
MQQLAPQSVDMILCDLPYGTTQCAWDVVIPFDLLWQAYERVAKPTAAIVLHGSQPFTTDLINSKRDWFRYELIWERDRPAGFLNAKRMPLKSHENLCVFYQKQPTYNPQFTEGKPNHAIGKAAGHTHPQTVYGAHTRVDVITNKKHPRSVLRFSKPHPSVYPTQKPLKLEEWLIQTYTNPNECVLDNCMGSGTTGIACANLGRKFIGIELDPQAFQLATERIQQQEHDVDNRQVNAQDR